MLNKDLHSNFLTTYHKTFTFHNYLPQIYSYGLIILTCGIYLEH